MSDFKLREVFNNDVVEYIASQIKSVYATFDHINFVSSITQTLNDLSFGDRSSLITIHLENYLPNDKTEAIKILINSLGPETKIEDMSGYDGFYIMPLSAFVARHGIGHFTLSMQALYEMTKRFTSEGPIRAFLRLDYPSVFSYLDEWVDDDNAHVRRLVSEGTRPRLPLASPLREFVDYPQKLEKYIMKLKNDPVLYVRRSVANNINDMSKDNPDYVCELLGKFNQKDKNEKWVVKHALRTLLKKTHPGALQLIGYTVPHEISEPNISLSQIELSIGDNLEFSFTFTSFQKQKLLIHYVIHYMKANGKQKPKVFILRDGEIAKGSHIIDSKQSFRQMSTRKHYVGRHDIEIQINGKVVAKTNFMITD